jgi:hypothetical protein
MTNNSFVVGLGHPRCGTAYFSNLLSGSGLDVGHEKLRTNGIVSWMLVGGRGCVPWGDSLPLMQSHQKKILVARSPLSAIRSVMYENGVRRSFAWRASVIFEKTGIDILCPTIIPQSHLSLSVSSLTYWYELCLQEDIGFKFRVDVESDLSLLSSYLNLQLCSSESLNRNHRPGNPHVFEIEMFQELPRRITTRFLELCHVLGYPDDAEKVSSHIRK